jgi:hypothetical protein
MKKYRGSKIYNIMTRMLNLDKKDFKEASAKLILNKNINI